MKKFILVLFQSPEGDSLHCHVVDDAGRLIHLLKGFNPPKGILFIVTPSTHDGADAVLEVTFQSPEGDSLHCHVLAFCQRKRS